MLTSFLGSFHWRQATSVVLFAGLVATTFAAGETPPAPSALGVLIERLAKRGVLSADDANTLKLLAEAEAAEASALAAATRAAEARAVAAEARVRALTALAASREGPPAAVDPLPARERPETEARVVSLPLIESMAVAEAERRVVRPVRPAPEPAVEAGVVPPQEAEPVAAAETERRVIRPARPAPESVAAEPAPAPPAAEAAAAEPADPDTVRVTYVPEVVEQRLREQVKQDVLAEARAEGWATPHAVPDWVGRFRFFGDLRVRYEGIHFPAGNDNTGAFPNFNAINTGAPFDVAGTVFSPQYNVDQDRQRFRLRARLGTAIELGDGFSSGLRIATGDNNSPVSQNQTLGAAGLAQGGNFSKYALWLDRAFLRYELGGLPDKDLMFTLGRQDNPYLATSMIWADDLGFDGFTGQGRLGLGESVTAFFTTGAYPVFNTDLNFATNQPAKFKSTDKWLYAAQLGASIDLGESINLRLAAAYYPFSGVEGRLSTPFTPVTAADAGDTDSTRPAFAQKGNTYMMLRNITPGPLNNQGTINQFQYFGLASKFRPLVADLRLEFNHFEPFQIALSGEYVKNLAFDAPAVAAIAVNNRGAATTANPQGVFLGQNTGWLATLSLGQAALQKRWDWNVNIGYRAVGSDAMIDGFVDSDFGGGGTNLKGMTFAGSLTLAPRVWLTLRWMSARQSTGPQFKSDILQFDVNGKF